MTEITNNEAMKRILSLFSVYLLVVRRCDGFTTGGMKTLRDAQLANSDRLVRPAATVTVKVQLNLLTINELNVKGQQLTSAGWLTVEWEDPRFSWTPASKNNIEFFYALQSEVWRPELIVDNSLADLGIISDSDLLFRVGHAGAVHWEIPRIFVTHCELDVTYFPFDTQRCDVELTSWAYTKSELILQHLRTSINLEDYRENGEWLILGSEVATHELTEHTGSTTETFAQLDFILIMQRRSTFYVLNTILPVILSSYLSLTVFLLPADSGEKVSYALTVLLALAVLLTLIADMLPSTSLHVSILGVYLAVILIVSTLSVLMTVLILRLYVKPETERKSRFLLRLVNLIGCIICWKRCCGSDNTVVDKESQVITNTGSTRVKKVAPSMENGQKERTASMVSSTLPNQPEVLTWKEISEILDRFFFWFFFFIVTLVTVICMSVLADQG